ncbi:MAG: Rho termination factor N-terminal domain-containing protein [Candidatus Thorarchaeota archaeon]
MSNKFDVKNKTVKELKEYAKKVGLKGYSTKKKNQLISMINSYLLSSPKEIEEMEMYELAMTSGKMGIPLTQKYKRFEDIPIGKISVKLTSAKRKLNKFEKEFPERIYEHFRTKEKLPILKEGDIIYFKSRKAKDIPYQVHKIYTIETNKGIYGLSDSYKMVALKNLQTGETDTKKEAINNIGNQLTFIFRNAERIVINGKTVWLEPKNWYEKLKKQYGY